MKTINVSIQKTCYRRGRRVGMMLENRPHQTIAQTIALLQKHGLRVSASTLYRLFRQPLGLVFVPQDNASCFVKIKLTTTARRPGYHELCCATSAPHIRLSGHRSDRALVA